MTTEVLTVEQDFTTLDLLVWRRFPGEATGRIERIMDRNPHVCDFVYLPIGTLVTVELPDPRAITRLPKVQLWE